MQKIKKIIAFSALAACFIWLVYTIFLFVFELGEWQSEDVGTDITFFSILGDFVVRNLITLVGLIVSYFWMSDD